MIENVIEGSSEATSLKPRAFNTIVYEIIGHAFLVGLPLGLLAWRSIKSNQ